MQGPSRRPALTATTARTSKAAPVAARARKLADRDKEPVKQEAVQHEGSRLPSLKTAPAMQSQEILASFLDELHSAGPQDMLLSARTHGSISARGGAATPLSRFLSETALQEKQRMLQLDRDAAVAALAQQQATQPAAPIPHPAPAAGQQAPVRGSGARKWACGCFGL